MSKEDAGRVGVAPSLEVITLTQEDEIKLRQEVEAWREEEDSPSAWRELERTSAADGAADEAKVQGGAPIPGQLLPWLLIVAAWARGRI